MKKLLLLDAYAIIYRSYYAFMRNPRINSKGLNTSAIFGFINTLEDVMRREKPTHIAVAFDPKGKTFRHEHYEKYKAQREATPEDIRLAVPIIKEIVAAYNIQSLEVPKYEADDVIGTIAKQAEKENFEVLMLTPDKDYAQLVSEHIFMYRPKHMGGYELLGPEEVKKKFDINDQKQVIDLLGLMGDASDNIPGCPGVGEKTAAKLLKEFGSIDELLERTEELKGALKIKIENNKENILFSRFLATIKTDVPVEFEENKLILQPKNEQALRALFEKLEFRSFLSKLFPGDSSGAASKKKQGKEQDGQMSLFGSELNENSEDSVADTGFLSQMKTIREVPHAYHLIDTREKRVSLLSDLLKQKSVCFDTETTDLNVFKAKMVGLSFCYTSGEAFYVSLPRDNSESTQIIEEFRPFFENEKIEKIAQNIKFDMLMLAQYGVALKGKLFDTMLAHYLLQPELRHGMDYLSEVYLKYRTIHYQDLVGAKGKKQGDIRDVDLSLLCDYASEDADVTFQLKQILEKEIKNNNLEDLFYGIEIPLVRVLATMEQNGVRIDAEALRQSSEILTKEALRLSEEIQEMAGVEFNVSSTKQVSEVLFSRLKIDEKAKKTKTGQFSTSEEVLEKLRSKHPIVGKILEFRGIKKLLSTYVDALPLLIDDKTGKIHTSYNQTVTATGRLSSSNPNLQNIPIRDARGKEIRKAFIPDENSVFLSADYSQIELRIMAHLSGDLNMLDAFKKGLDIHAATAAEIYKIPLNEVTSEMRRKAKTANFGIIYGISVFGLSQRLDIPNGEAKGLIDGYFRTYPGVMQYMENVVEKAKKEGYVETLFGRKRFLSNINSENKIVRSAAERNAINTPIQGTAADIIKIAMVRIQERFDKEAIASKMIMQVHDELNFTVLNHELEHVKKIVVEEMEQAFQMEIPLVVDCGFGENWLQAH